MIHQVDATTYKTEQRGKTFTLLLRDGYCHVLSHLTSDPEAKAFWGCRTFGSVDEVDVVYKAFRGISILLEIQ